MKKQFVTYKIALTLEDIGFNEECFCTYSPSEILHHEQFDDELLAPLWQQVIDYFRTNHNIVIELTRFEHTDDVVEWAYIIEKWDGNVIVEYHDCEHFKTYEEAREAAILEAIKLVKENKK